MFTSTYLHQCREHPTVTTALEARPTALDTSERTSSRRENVTAKRETQSLLVFGEKHGPVDADWCFDVCIALERVCEEVNLTHWVDSLDTLDEVTEDTFSAWVRTKGQNVLDMQWALKQLCYVLDPETDWTSQGVHSGRDGKRNYARSHNLETGADPRSGNNPESKTGAYGCCVTPQEGKLVRRACRAGASLEEEVRKVPSVRFEQRSLSIVNRT